MDLYLIGAMIKYNTRVYHRMDDCYQYEDKLLVQKLRKFIA